MNATQTKPGDSKVNDEIRISSVGQITEAVMELDHVADMRMESAELVLVCPTGMEHFFELRGNLVDLEAEHGVVTQIIEPARWLA